MKLKKGTSPKETLGVSYHVDCRKCCIIADASILVSFLPACLSAHKYRPTTATALASARTKPNSNRICLGVGEKQEEEDGRLTIRTLYAVASRLFLLLGLGTLDLGGTTEGLLSVLALLACSDGKSMSAARPELLVVSTIAAPVWQAVLLPSTTLIAWERVYLYVRCCLEAFSIFLARPTRTRR